MLWNWFGLDHSDENKLNSDLAQSDAAKAGFLSQYQQYINGLTKQNQDIWGDYTDSLGDYNTGIDKLVDQQNGVYSNLARGLSGNKSVESLVSKYLQDPQLAERSSARGLEEANLGKIGALTGIQETAEEKLMRAMADRDNANKQRAQREATAQNLKARGVYGSGAEIASALQGGSDAAQNRQLSDLGGQANAQKRALQAQGLYQQGASALGQADDAMSKFNAQLLQQNNQAQAQLVGNARQADNTAKNNAAATLATAGTNATQLGMNALNQKNQNAQTAAQGQIGVNNNAGAQQQALVQMQTNAEKEKQANEIARQKDGGLLGGLLSGIFD